MCCKKKKKNKLDAKLENKNGRGGYLEERKMLRVMMFTDDSTIVNELDLMDPQDSGS